MATDDNGFAINATGTLTVPAPGVLANDTLNGGAITNFPTTTTRGGTVQLTPDGGFTYTAPATSGADTFQYSLTSANGTSTATVNIQVVGNAVFVNNQAAAGGNGSFAAPFNTIGAAVAAVTGGNNTIFVFRGNGNAYNEAITLQDGQRLIGEGAGLAVLGRGEGEALEQAVAPNFPVLTGPITMGNGNTVQGLRFENSTQDVFTVNSVGGTISGNQFDVPGQIALNFMMATGTWTIANNSFTGAGAGIFVFGNLMTGDVTYIINNNTFTGMAAAMSLSAAGTVNLRAQVTNNTASGLTDPQGYSFTTVGNSTMCVDMTGNTSNNNVRFSQSQASILNVEQFSQLSALNNNANVVVQTGNVTDVANGFCNF